MFVDFLILFGSAFLAATLLPFYSELFVAAILARLPEMAFWIWLVASLGNTLGAAVNWALGRYLLHYQARKWFPFKANSLAASQKWFSHYGVWSLLFAWLPIGGDALTFIAGVMRVPFGLFFALTFTGKAVRYAAVIFFAELLMDV